MSVLISMKPSTSEPLLFSKSLRLLNSKEFEWVFENPSLRASNQHCLILSRLNNDSKPKLGLIISKKHIRLAVDRNRVKRIIRESFRLRQHQLPAINAIVLARKGLDKLENQEIHDLLEKLWLKISKKAKS